MPDPAVPATTVEHLLAEQRRLYRQGLVAWKLGGNPFRRLTPVELSRAVRAVQRPRARGGHRRGVRRRAGARSSRARSGDSGDSEPGEPEPTGASATPTGVAR